MLATTSSLAQLRTTMWLSKLIVTIGGLLSCNFYFVVHTAWYCLDAICLNSNVWINISLRPGKMVSGMTATCERAVKWCNTLKNYYNLVSKFEHLIHFYAFQNRLNNNF